jgi:hypothetical protein
MKRNESGLVVRDRPGHSLADGGSYFGAPIEVGDILLGGALTRIVDVPARARRRLAHWTLMRLLPTRT